MEDKLYSLAKEAADDIQRAHQEGVTLEEAERLAAKFLGAQMALSQGLSEADLDARMKKAGTKAIKAAVYMEEATRGDKKPSDTFIQNIIDINKLVQDEQRRLDEAEVKRDAIERYFGIFHEAHVSFRGVAKGRFE